ncbi:MAG TPA: RnfABCDGE type electron transport complex subunit D [Gemmatimonadaceae bacterium]
MPAKKFFKTPKGLLIVVMAILTVVAVIGQPLSLVLPLIGAAVGAAMLVDLPILRYREGAWTFPDGALLTGLFVALILTPHEPWWVAALTSAVAILSKYVLRAGRANVFNPAAIALFISYFLFHTGQSWWGSLPELPLAVIVVLLGTGIFITQRVNKVPVVISFLGAYYLLFTLAAFVSDPRRVSALYRAPDLHMALFFAFFMVTDPPTSPPKHREQWIYGVIVAAVSFAVFETIGAVYFLFAGLLVANAWEAVRRSRARAARSSRAGEAVVA